MKLQKVQPEIFDYLWQNRVIFRQINTLLTEGLQTLHRYFKQGRFSDDAQHGL